MHACSSVIYHKYTGFPANPVFEARQLHNKHLPETLILGSCRAPLPITPLQLLSGRACFPQINNYPQTTNQCNRFITRIHSSKMHTVRCNGRLCGEGGGCPRGCLPRGCTPQPVNRITDRCKNITFSQIFLRTVSIFSLHMSTFSLPKNFS